MAWIPPVSHIGTGPGWHDPENAYQEAGYAWHDTIHGGLGSPPPYIHWSDWLQLQLDGTYAVTAVKFSVGWIFPQGPPNIIPYIHIQVYTGSWETVYGPKSRPSGPSWITASFSEKNVSQVQIRFGSPYTFPRNNVEPRVNGSYVQLYLAPGAILKHCLDQNSNPVVGVGVDLLLGEIVVDTGTSDEDGEISFGDLDPDTYGLSVEVVPEGYELTEEPEDVVVGEGETVDAYNYFMLLGAIIKHCLDQYDDAVVGVGVDLLLDEVVVDTGTSGGDGEIPFNDLHPGTYGLRVELVPEGYELDAESADVVVVGGETVDAYNYFMLLALLRGRSSLALAGAGYPHIGYFNEALEYAYWNGAAWRLETVDSEGEVGEHCSLALAIRLSGAYRVNDPDSDVDVADAVLVATWTMESLDLAGNTNSAYLAWL